MVPYYTHLVSAPCDISLVRSFLSVSLQRSFSLYQLVGIRSNQRRITITDLRWCDMVTPYSCLMDPNQKHDCAANRHFAVKYNHIIGVTQVGGTS